MSDAPVAVVGAGPYGLSVAAHLRARDVPFRIFGRPMETWRRHMPEGMFLKSEGFASNIADPHGQLTLHRFCSEMGRSYGDSGVPVALDTFVGYGAWFQEQAVPEVEQVDVAEIRRRGNAFTLVLSSGETTTADRVVLATGVAHFAHLPEELVTLPPALRSHTADHASLSVFRGRKVAVVGGGQSALETAALLREAGGLPHVVVRRPALSWNPRPEEGPRTARAERFSRISPLGSGWKLRTYWTLKPAYRYLRAKTRVDVARRTLGPAGAWWLRERLADDVHFLLGHRVGSAVEDRGRVRLTLENGGEPRTLVVDHVIAGTGYRVHPHRLRFLAADLAAQLRLVSGAPRLSAHFESSLPGLYFVGLPAAHTFGPAMRFVCGSAFAARRVAADIARSDRRPRTARPQRWTGTRPSR